MVIEGLVELVGVFVVVVCVFFEGGGKGINVIVLFKFDVFVMFDEWSVCVMLVGVVNVFKFDGDCIWVDNFDGIGLVCDIEVNFWFLMVGKCILLFGVGGVVCGVLLLFFDVGLVEFVVVNCDVDKVCVLVLEVVGCGMFIVGGYVDFVWMGCFDLVVNVMLVSLIGNLLFVLLSVFSLIGMVYELVYGKCLMLFFWFVKNVGVYGIVDGVGMLVE